LRRSLNKLARGGCLAIALIAGGAIAHADGEIDKLMTAADKARLASYDKIRAEAIEEARKGGTKEDIATLDAILAGQPLSFSEDFDLTGNWQCRTLKLAGNPALTVYGWFKCRVSDDGSGWKL